MKCYQIVMLSVVCAIALIGAFLLFRASPKFTADTLYQKGLADGYAAHKKDIQDRMYPSPYKVGFRAGWDKVTE